MIRRATKSGLSLLEILIAMVLLTVVITTFAAIYPLGFQLHRKSAQATRAAQLATAIIEEVQSLPLTNEGGGLSLAFMAENPWTAGGSGYEDFPRTEIPDGFFLEDDTGIKVQTYDLVTGGAPTDLAVYAQIQVTVAYRSERTRGNELIPITVTASKTWNR